MRYPPICMTITVGAPEVIDGREGRRVLAEFYGTLLGMDVIREDWLKIAKGADSPLHLALDSDGWSDLRPPRWPDSEHPQQMHLDIAVADFGAGSQVVDEHGGRLLQDNGHWRVYADPAGHPLCLYEAAGAGDDRGPGTVGALTIDCLSPRSLATFYEGLLGVERRSEDTPDRVVIDLADSRFPNFAFQHSVFVAARWPDPAYPAQLHVDLPFGDGRDAAIERAERLGGVRLPDLADSAVFADPAGHPFCL